jgi:hypothetical protein
MDKEYFTEVNFSCVLRGEVTYLEEIKERITREYVEKGLVSLVNPTYDKNTLHILTENQWKEYQKLKKRDERLIGAGFP